MYHVVLEIPGLVGALDKRMLLMLGIEKSGVEQGASDGGLGINLRKFWNSSEWLVEWAKILDHFFNQSIGYTWLVQDDVIILKKVCNGYCFLYAGA